MATLLLATKLFIPALRPGLVPRPRLIQRLDEGLRLGRKLTLISAPAGYGKTTLLSEWIASRKSQMASQQISKSANRKSPIRPFVNSAIRRFADARFAWLSLAEGDNDPARFLTYLVASLQMVEAGIGSGTLAASQIPQPVPVEELLAALVNQINAIPGSLVLVLDDCHLITAQAVHDALTFLLEHLPANLHLVIATRADPPLPVARLRGRGQLTELRQADLCFTLDEAAVFLNTCMGLGLSADDVATLGSRTEGWIAGLQMAALALQARASTRGQEDVAGFIRTFTSSDRHILDYLVEEVLQRQPASVQRFLLQTSILERLCGPLGDAVIGNQRVSESANQPTDERVRFADLPIWCCWRPAISMRPSGGYGLPNAHWARSPTKRSRNCKA